MKCRLWGEMAVRRLWDIDLPIEVAAAVCQKIQNPFIIYHAENLEGPRLRI